MHYLPEDMITLKAVTNFYYPGASTSWWGGLGQEDAQYISSSIDNTNQ